MDGSRQQVVTEFVHACFNSRDSSRRFATLDSVTRDEVQAVVLRTLLEHGRFPMHAAMVAGDPPMFIGEQVCSVANGNYLVTNIDFYDHASTDGSSTRVFANPTDAVAYFVRATVRNKMYGIPVV